MKTGTDWPIPASRAGRGQLSDEASDYLRELVVSGQIRPGTRVRPELIAEALDISSTPAREALQALRVEGFLRYEPRRGFTVAHLTGADIRDVFTAQSLLAGELAARATSRANATDLDNLEKIQDRLRAAAARDDAKDVEQLNHDFHRTVNLLAAAPKIAATIGLLSKYAPRRFYASISGWQAATLEDHDALLRALAAHDPTAARAAMATHILHAGELLAAHYDERVDSSDQ
ncbi:GntR family transcriptional regulator [Microbacterium lacus]|uniref:GntR family transcriptional regulator n=1 Tax=Microbacterium lacus TaxID=415217 RepID=A0ABN2HAR9_9MICO